MAYNYSTKRRIAKNAAEMVEEGDTIMIESGSCCAFLAEELVASKKNITIITNSIFITNYVRHKPDIKIILLGGYYQPDSQVLVGPMTVKNGEVFFSSKFFIGADGFLPNFGFTGKDHIRVQTIR
jgi:DeoR/GlpR family transcriptional regulator of sugar metabolism